MTSRLASIVIRVEKSKGGSRFRITAVGGKPLFVGEGLEGGKMREHYEEMRICLETFKQSIGAGRETSNWDDISAAIHTLFYWGRQLAYDLFSPNIGEVQALFHKALPFWRDSSKPPRVIQLASPLEGIIPIEFLPLFDLRPPPEINDIRSLEEVASRFVGFSAIIKRTITNRTLSTDPTLENDPKLPVKFFHHAGLKGAQLEDEFFRRHGEHIDLEGPWPDKEITETQLTQYLAEHIYAANKRFDGSHRFPPDQVQHFSCHCDTSDDLSSNHFLQFAHREDTNCAATIGGLKGHFATLQQTSPRKKGTALPLVFFNACGTAVTNPAQIASFADLILRNGNRGIIGTESNIPDAFAASFSEQFYRELLKGCRLGDALHRAKWLMLKRHRNPLGILYMVYADPDIHVQTGLDF